MLRGDTGAIILVNSSSRVSMNDMVRADTDAAAAIEIPTSKEIFLFS